MTAPFYAGQTDYIDQLNAMAADYDGFAAVWLGPKAADPTTDNSGNPLVAGALYRNTVTGTVKEWTGTAWLAWMGVATSGNAPSALAVNSSSTALTITQDGTGNALEVRDVTGDSTPFVVDASGNVLLGAASRRSVGNAFQTATSSQLFNELSSGDLVGATVVLNRNDSNGPLIVIGKSRGTAPGGVAAVQSGDNLGVIRFAGADGTSLDAMAAQIVCAVDGTPGTNDMPGRLVFSTTRDGASSPTEVLRIGSNGNLLQASGSFYIGGTSVSTDAVSLEIGNGRTGSGFAYIDLIGDTTNTDYGLRIIRGNSGANAVSSVSHKGTGGFNLIAENAAAVSVYTNNTERMRIDSSGNVGIGGAAVDAKLDVIPGTLGNALRVRSSSSTSLGQIQFTDSGATTPWATIYSSSGSLSLNHSSITRLTVGDSEKFRVNSSSQALAMNSTGLGYGTGSGGTVTQATSKSTAVTLNKPSGQITMHNAALAAGATVTFTLSNTSLSPGDTLLVHPNWGSQPDVYQAWCAQVGVSGAIVAVRNISGGSLSDAIVLNFNVIKGSTS